MIDAQEDYVWNDWVDKDGELLFVQIPYFVLWTIINSGEVTFTETKILLYICRMTYGFVKNRIFQKKTGKLDQKKFIQYTHLNKGQVSKALKGLKNKNIILENPKGVYSINSRPFGIDPETLKSVKE